MDTDLDLLDAWWRAANHLAVGQIVSAPGAAARTVVVHSREDVVIAEQVAAVLGSGEQ